ncbi:MAG: heavy metal translocating P-type ATPase [Magnetococcales bacterium]|nr:heavy metal translocating P-type ATPase [Magnetococcales bacterium]
MFLDMGVVVGAYALLRWYERQRDKNEELIRQSEGALVVVDEPSEEDLYGQSQVSILSAEEEREKHLHFLKASGATIGLSIFSLIYPPAIYPTLALFTYSAIPYMREVENSIFVKKKVDGWVLYGVADILTLGIGRIGTAAFAVSLVHTAKFVISHAEDRSRKKLIDIFDQQPRNAWVLKDGLEIKVDLDQININDIVVVNTGEMVPIDGVVTEGVATIDQHKMTGESQPVEKVVNDDVFAATLVITGRILIRVTSSGQQTAVAQITHIINKSTDFQTATQLRGEKWADSWSKPVMGLAIASAPWYGITGFITILNGHIAQTIRLTAPLSTLNHIKYAANRGILIKDGRVLEELHKIDTILFDKTGTLTSEEPKVGDIHCFNDQYNKEELLVFAAATEGRMAHPIAHAIVKRSEALGLICPEVDDRNFQVGNGISASVNNRLVQVGSKRFMESQKVMLPEGLEDLMQTSREQGHALILVAIDGKVQGALEIESNIRPEVHGLMKQLRNRGVKHLAIVSGDHRYPTEKLARELGMDDYFYDVLPQDKGALVDTLHAEGRTICFVGDGVNDAIAMKKADISISLSGATSIATDTAQILLMDGSLKRLPELIDLSHRLEENLQRALSLNTAPGVAIVFGTLLFRIDILVAILISQSGMMAGIANAYLPFVDETSEQTTSAKTNNPTNQDQIDCETTQRDTQQPQS